MDSLERLAQLLVQQHALQPAASGGAPLPAGGGSVFAPALSGAGLGSDGAAPPQQQQQQQLQQPQQQQGGDVAATGDLAGGGGTLGATLASLLQQHQQQSAEQLVFDHMSRDSSADLAVAGGAPNCDGHTHQLELAKAVAQVVINELQKHPACDALKQMGAAISKVLLKCVAPAGLGASPAPTPQQQPQPQQQQQQQHMLLAALLSSSGGAQPLGPSAETMLLRHLADGAGVDAPPPSGPDALLAAALSEHLQQQPSWQEDASQSLFRPTAMRAPQQALVGGADLGSNTRAWPQLVQSLPQGGSLVSRLGWQAVWVRGSSPTACAAALVPLRLLCSPCPSAAPTFCSSLATPPRPSSASAPTPRPASPATATQRVQQAVAARRRR